MDDETQLGRDRLSWYKIRKWSTRRGLQEGTLQLLPREEGSWQEMRRWSREKSWDPALDSRLWQEPEKGEIPTGRRGSSNGKLEGVKTREKCRKQPRETAVESVIM